MPPRKLPQVVKKSPFRSGFIAIIGKPNVGKSTLINQLVHKKITITSPKPQTTRQRILGIKTTESYQMIFVDTPGLSMPRHLLGKKMILHAREALVDCDVCLFLVQATHAEPKEEDRWGLKILLAGLKERNIQPPIYLVINKIDEVKDKRKLLPIIERYSALAEFSEVFPISALKGENLEGLEQKMLSVLPENPQYFPAEEMTAQDETFRICEIIREKVLFHVHQEVPHGVAVAVEEMRPGKDKKTLYIRAAIFVERESHKPIIVGAEGKLLKRIGTLARKEIAQEHGRPVFLDLWVKVKEDWQDREDLLRQFGYL